MAPAPVSLPLGRRSGPRVRFGVLGPWGASGQGWGPLGEILLIFCSSFQENTQDHSPAGMAL